MAQHPEPAFPVRFQEQSSSLGGNGSVQWPTLRLSFLWLLGRSWCLLIPEELPEVAMLVWPLGVVCRSCYGACAYTLVPWLPLELCCSYAACLQSPLLPGVDVWSLHPPECQPCYMFVLRQLLDSWRPLSPCLCTSDGICCHMLSCPRIPALLSL